MAAKMDALKNAKCSKSKLGKFIVNFAEFTNTLSDTDWDPLFDALDALTDSLEDQLAAAQQANSDAEVVHNNLIINYENNRDSANSDIVSTNQTLADLDDDQVYYENQIAQAQDDTAADNEAIVDLNEARTDRVNAYTQDVEDADSGIDTIDEALALLRSLQTSSDVSSFIQTNDQAFINIKNKLQKSFESLSSKKRSHSRYRPLLMAVVEIMNKQNFVNQDGLIKVIDLLVDLRGDISDFMTKLDSDEAAAEDNYQAQLDGLNNAIELATEAQATAQTNLDNTNANIASQTDFLNQRTEDYNNALDAISTENDLWNQKVQAFNELVDEINSELRVVEEAVGALNAGGVVRSSDESSEESSGASESSD